jgi:hypothetical protein
VLYPSLLSRLGIFVAERTAVGSCWSFGSKTLLHFCMIGKLTVGNGLLALWAAFIVLVLLTLSQQVVIEVSDFNCLAALLAESDHRAS